MWRRDPFYGGVHYHWEEDDVLIDTITGLYNPENPVEFESDCKEWKVKSLGGMSFESLDDAIMAAEIHDEIKEL